MREQKGIKPTSYQSSAETRIAAIKFQLRVNSQPQKSVVMKKEGKSPTELAWGRSSITTYCNNSHETKLGKRGTPGI